ncbi:MAG: nitrogenase iron-molybdenum cofactor biosynthesis protein NifN [Aquabacterium sp.]|uniref:nitrogenase iron-molybdenum cofactor biosynthesis protein NifN n=1 Tax=Aquabacterium sp. TaxID=1872578 RepID=UPI001205B2AD|nr:nitrogenase iron-molybdenum cofactor biosynthesis protein NifN [Aquabacterium sp.]TAK98072.1 MAG: nitrogenase iron-molybdenum cofactor biosynthesis protein NifN [Aquabacterium sp.]
MAQTVESRKACAVNPLKMSQPLGASYAFMGMDSCMPVMHGSQGCTSFGLVLLVRHFKEAIPLQTTAMNEVTTILGGYENIETALLNIKKRANPQLIAICSTGLTETKGDDVDGYLNLVRQRKPELDETAIVYVSTPDYVGAFEDGWRLAVAGMVKQLVPDTSAAPKVGAAPRQVNLLPGSHLTPGDIEEIKQILGDFGLSAITMPDVSGSLDGHIPSDWRGTTLGGTRVEELTRMGESVATLAIGQQMADAAKALEARTGVPVHLFDRLTGLACNDRFLMTLSSLSGQAVPQKYRRQRSQLLDAMLDGHFYLGAKTVAIGAEPDLLYAVGAMLHEMGAVLHTCVTTTHSAVLEKLPAETALIGDLEDLEKGAAQCDLMMTHSHGRQAAERLGTPFLRIGFPIFDRIGNAHRLMVGYRGTRQFIFEVANLMMAHIPHAEPDSWPLPDAAQRVAKPALPAVAELPWPIKAAPTSNPTADGVTP